MTYTIGVFEPIFESMADVMLRDWTRRCLEAAPAYFWKAPASLTGEFHPPEDRTEGGLVRHSIKVAQIANKLFECLEANQDEAKVAGMLHDIAKYGLNAITSTDYADYANHADVAAQWLEMRIADSGLPPESLDVANDVIWDIRKHMGKWGTNGAVVRANNHIQWAFHFADVVASMPQMAWTDFYKVDDWTALLSDEAAVPITLETERRWFIEEDGERVFNFGKRKGQKVQTVLDRDYQYVSWIIHSSDMDDSVKDILREELEMRRKRNTGTLF